MITKPHFCANAVSVAALLLMSGLSHAAIVVYETQSDFAAAVSSPGVDTYLGFSITTPTPSPIIRAAGSYGYVANASKTSFYGAGTTVDPWLSTNTAIDMITFIPSSAVVSAIGGNFFCSTVIGAFAAGDMIVTAEDAAGSSVTRTITGATISSFRGFVSDSPPIFLVVAAVQPATPIWPTVDNLTLAVAAVTDRIFEDGFE